MDWKTVLDIVTGFSTTVTKYSLLSQESVMIIRVIRIILAFITLFSIVIQDKYIHLSFKLYPAPTPLKIFNHGHNA